MIYYNKLHTLDAGQQLQDKQKIQQPLLSNCLTNKHVQQKNGVFCAVHADML
jgi:hypothetical protein